MESADFKNPMFSVVIPLYNKVNEVSKTLQSVFNQTYTGFEIVIVDDGSTDGSIDIINKIIEDSTFQSSQLKLIRQSNAGVSAARNRGISESRGKYIALLDADDEWKPEYLTTQAALIRKYPGCEVFATNYEFKNDKGLISPTILRNIKFNTQDGVLDNYFEVASCSHPPLWTSAVCISKKAIESIGGFPVGIKSGEDLLTYARLLLKFKVAFTYKIQAIYNLGEGYDYSKEPPRKQDDSDPVGKELLELYQNNTNIPGFKTYISHWHKMRASVALRFGFFKETLVESFLSLRYNPRNYKVIPFIILIFLPRFLRIKIFKLHR